jgi:hypothetical protein
MQTVWILHAAPVDAGRGGAVEVCTSETYARKGAPHHHFRQECVRWTLGDDGDLRDPVSLWTTDEHGNPPGEGSWALKLGDQQVRFLVGCLQFGGWYKGCGWQLHRNVRHDERVATRLVERGLLVTQERTNAQGVRFKLHTVANPPLAAAIVKAGGVVPESALKNGEVRR